MTIYIGAEAPESVKATVRRGALDIDLTLATSAAFEVSRPDGTETEWSAVLSLATPSQVVLVHTFDGTDLLQEGNYYLVPKLTVPGGTIRAKRFTVAAVDPFRRP